MSTTVARRGMRRRSGVWIALGILIPFDAIALLFAGIVHLIGARIPLGVAVFVEPPILPAGIVETLAGALFVWATVALWQARTAAWMAALVAHLFAIAGFLVGLYSTRLGTTPFNALYHRVMVVVFIVGLILLMLPSAHRSVQRSAAQRTS
jgi:hypothetical protein